MGDAVTNRMRAAEWCGTHEPKVEYLQCGDSRMCMTALLDEAEQRGRDAGVREERARCLEIARTVREISRRSGETDKAFLAHRIAQRIDIGYGCVHVGCDCSPPHEHVSGVAKNVEGK